MNIPNLPTDNLYKFIALSGILLVLISIFIPFQKRQELSLERTDMVGRDSILHVEMRGYKSHLNYIKSLMKVRGFPVLELERKTSEAESTGLQIELKYQELENQKNKISILTSQMEEQSNYFYYGSLSGSVLALIGFLLWYYKVQRYQDKILRQQAKQAA